MPGPYRLHVAIDRGHGPVYVLLHGINSTGHDWDTVVTAMGFDRRCIAVDELGYGNSPKPLDIDYTLDDHVESLRHTLREIGVDEPFTLVGYSMGGPIALRYAATYREEVGRLVLISAPFFLDPQEMGDEAYAKAVFQTKGSQAVLDLVRSTGFAKSGVFKALSADDKQVIQGFINAQDLKTDWEILQKNMGNVIQGSDFPGDLPHVKAPITFMVGEHDAFIVQSQIETLRARYAPNMEIRYLADLKADHMLLENVPTMMAEQITRWEDRRLAVALDRGEGRIHVFLHGVENDGSFWNEVGVTVATRNRAVSLDMLGFGLSPKPLDVAYSADDQVASISATLDSLLGEDARFTMVGHSLGSLVAGHFARRFPHQVERLVLFAPPVQNDDVDAGSAHFDQARSAFVDNIGTLREGGHRLARARLVRNALGHHRLDRYEPSLRSLKNVVEKQTLAEDLLATPDIPVTIVHGTRDPFVVPEYARALAELREGIEIVTVDAAHDVAHERPVESVLAIDPVIDPALIEELTEKAKTDRKLRPSTGSLQRKFDADAWLVGLRGAVFLAWGLGLVFLPQAQSVNLLRLGFAAFLFARSLSTVTGLFTTNSIRQEKVTSALMGFVGIVLGVFTMVTPTLARSIIVLLIGGYLVMSGGVSLFAAYTTRHSRRKRTTLLLEGWGALVVGVALIAGSAFAYKLVLSLLVVGSIALGVSLISFALLSRKMGNVWDATTYEAEE